jgi:SEC-C motif-containing protein
MKTQDCPCGTGKAYQDCCDRYISNQEIPSTPEQLMRSRYTAYSQANIDYIVRTMKSPAADNYDVDDAQTWAKEVRWTGLDVVKSSHDAEKGFVEFKAYYHVGSKKNVLHEVSEFHFKDGRWYYVTGILKP